MDLTIYTDGGSLNNPGPAASAYLIYRGSFLISSSALAIGEASNNVAEYTALIMALAEASKLASTMSLRHIHCYADSSLMINQLRGVYKIKHPDMRVLAAKVKSIASSIPATVTYTYVPREKNAAADALVKKALGR